MKKYLALLLSLVMIGTLTACGSSGTAGQTGLAGSVSESTSGDTEASQASLSDGGTAPAPSSGKTLVAYFAYSENMGDTSGMEVDAISSASLNRRTYNAEGNLQVMAQIIEEETGADVFHILVEQPYAADYSTMLPTAIEQMENKDWPALQGAIENLADYDVIYLGTPVWNSGLPPAMQTFFAENDLSGKTIIPFGIHLGSGFGRMISEMKDLAPEATVLDGFTINAYTANDEVGSEFRDWMVAQNLIEE